MKTFAVMWHSYGHTDIEAETADQAEAKFWKMFNAGDGEVDVSDELQIDEVEEIT